MRKALVVVAILAVVAAVVAWQVYRTSQKTTEDAPEAPAIAEAPVETPPVAEPTEARAPEEPPAVPASAPEEPMAQPAPPAAITRVYGTVTDAKSGAPVADARIESAGRPWREEDTDKTAAAKSDEHGAFALEAKLGETLALTCAAAGYADARREVSRGEHDNPPGELRVDFFLEPGVAVSGTVRDAESSEGVEGVSVLAISGQGGLIERMQRAFENMKSAETDTDGRYALRGLTPGAYRVVLNTKKTGYVFTGAQVKILNIETGRAYDGVDFDVSIGGVVEGTITDNAGAPLIGAKAQLIPAQLAQSFLQGMDQMEPMLMNMESRNAETDEQGAYSIVGLEFDKDYRVMVEAEGFAANSSEAFRVAADSLKAVVNLTLMQGSRVAGKALRPDGQPAADYRLMLMPDMNALMSGRISEPQNATTGEDGAFEFTKVGAGKYTLQPAGAMPFPMFGKREDTLNVEVDGVRDLTGLKLTIHPDEDTYVAGDGVIKGTVLSPAGDTVAKVRVEATRADQPMETAGARTEDDGSFAITKLPGPRYNLSVTSKQGRAEMDGVSAGSTVTLRLSPPTRVSGVVVDAQGVAVASCKVRLAPEGGQQTPDSMQDMMLGMFGVSQGSAETDISGYFEFLNVEPGRYTAKAESRGKGTGESQAFAIAAGANLDHLRIQLAAGVSFSGVVVSGDNQPVSGAKVSLTSVGENQFSDMMSQFVPFMGKTAASATSGQDGRFVLNGVAAGNYRVEGSHPMFAKYINPSLTVTAGRDVRDYRVVLPRAARASGRIMRDGAPASGVMVQLVGTMGMQMAMADENGNFDFSGITPGEYMIQYVDVGRMMSEGMAGMGIQTPEFVEIGEGAELEIDFGPGQGVPVTGSLATEGLGTFTQVMLRRPGGPAPEDLNPMDLAAQIQSARYLEGMAFVGTAGAFSMEGVEPGTYILEVFSMNMDLANPDIGALMNMDRTPQLRQEVTIGENGEVLNLSLAPPAQ